MANKKNKIELRDSLLSLRSELEQYWSEDYHYWDYEPCLGGCTCRYCRPWDYEDDEYEYISHDIPEYNYISRRGGLMRPMSTWTGCLKSGGIINLDKVYSKEVMRDKKIDEILGLGFKKPTIWVFYEKRRDI
jgi:hypothetical protein